MVNDRVLSVGETIFRIVGKSSYLYQTQTWQKPCALVLMSIVKLCRLASSSGQAGIRKGEEGYEVKCVCSREGEVAV